MKLELSRDLKLPADAVTETFAILAKRGAGKTYTASVLVEEFLKAKLQTVVVDPVGAWWGLRSSADGKSEGFPIAILGGDKGDVPLEATGGHVVADLVVDERLSVVLDLSSFSKNERRDFVRYFLERLYQRNRDAMHVVLEEADLFAPEGTLRKPGDEFMLGAVYDLVRRGRARGIGSTLITQRSASLSKEVLTQAEILIALRTTGPHDRKAIEEWIKYHGSKDERDIVLGELSGLPTGEAYVWWPVEEILRRVKIRERSTFDSSATPKPGQTRRAPKTVADVDLDALTERMAATIEKAKAEDPRELRKTIADLQKQLRARPTETKVETKVERVEVPAISEELAAQLACEVTHLHQIVDVVGPLEKVAQAILDSLACVNVMVTEAQEQGERKEAPVERPGVPPARRPAPDPPTTAGGSEPRLGVDGLKTPQARVLNALAWLESLGLEGDRIRVAFLAGYRPNSGNFGNLLGGLRTLGLVEYPRPACVALTAAGRSLADPPSTPTTTEELQRAVMAKLKGPQQTLLRQLINAYPEMLSREQLGDRTGYSASSGNFGNLLGNLRSLGLVGYPSPGFVVAEDMLFL